MVIVLEKLNGALARSIGLVPETIAAYKKQEDHDIMTEEDWGLDQIGHDLRSDPATAIPEVSNEEFNDEGSSPRRTFRNPSHQADEFLKRHPLLVQTPGGAAFTGRLPHPVIIPQRRPGDRLHLLVTFTRASRAPKWMAAFNLAGNAGFAIPAHAAGFGVGVAVQIVTAIVMELKGRSQSIKRILEEAEDGFFRPRGLYCLVMSFDNTHESALTEDDLIHNAHQASIDKSGLKKYTSKLRSNDGVSEPVAFLEAAPLVFPELDWLAENGSVEQRKKLGGYVKFRKFVADYFDRRAEADYVPAAPTRGFASRYGDPSDATNLSPLSLATHGLVPYSRSAHLERNRGGNRKIKDMILYLIMINMPSDEDLRRAEDIVEGTSVASGEDAGC
ncbi:hypothetical protein BU23DRAFT_579478 [Bimuria novae-zelandiae CBS 107.79]|uniref:Uncharacterized protein n=1 Tax=Bimuria novae-zelandiae CBS 107.79 TaxID=1447943 RepID=A0A6A5VB54_9PLEO|nr:hypothetical protein BU23DRAFT_579478 [Bimuria novae-zelandiae CBS 107.79]